MRKYSRETLQKRLERLEDSLYKEQLRLHRQINSTGWGTGIRCTKCTPSFRREDELRAKIRAVREQLKEPGTVSGQT